jgi:glycosyltransferase involved in cell wall biosynthesis
MEVRRTGRIIVVFCGRFPNEKADSLFAHMNADSFAQSGVETILIAPRRFGRGAVGDRRYRVMFLPTIDLMPVPLLRIAANYVNLAVFSGALFLWLLFHRQRGDIVLSNEPFPLLLASYLTPTLFEVHVSPAGHGWFYRAVFHRALLALPINEWNARFAELNGMPRERVLVSRSAVDIELFREVDKGKAREQLGLGDERIALYTGHLYAWKGAETLAKAAELAPEIMSMFVGGTAVDIERFKKEHGGVPNIRIIGSVPHSRVPLWQSAADVLVLPNSAAAEISLRFTSPMKLFEYAASGRPIVASDLPSIREVLTDESAYFATPDDPASFSETLRRVLTNPEEAGKKAIAARHIAEEHTWRARTARILKKIRTLPSR